MHRILGQVLMAASIVLAAGAGWLAWQLKDGLGPESEPSSGLAALAAAAGGGWHLFLPAVVLAAAGAFLARGPKRRGPLP